LDRRALLAHISRSVKSNGSGRHPRAAYRMVLSPERAEGLDLKALTRAAVDQLGRDAGGTPPWIAAIHRNTKHPHVHIVMAARREIKGGHFRTVVINPTRLAHMKSAMSNELSRQRSGMPAHVPMRLLSADAHYIGQSRRRTHANELGLAGGLGQILEAALHAVATHQRRELRRWLIEEQHRLQREAERQGHQRIQQLDR
jgi:MobA/VirD2-like, nuclease domain